MKGNLIRAYSATNLGDDLFIKILCDRYPRQKFYIIADKKHSKPFETISNLKVINPVSFIDKIILKLGFNFTSYNILSKKIAKKNDSVVHIGGSIFMQNSNWSNRVKEYDKLIKSSNNFFVLGSNFGPYQDHLYFEKYNNLFKNINDICFRDNHSYSKFQSLDNVRKAPDIVFALDSDKIIDYKLNNYFVISVINLENRKELKEYQKLYEQAIIDISKQLIDRGKKVVLMSFCEREGDEVAIKRIKKQYSHEKLKAYFYKGNMPEALSVIKSSEGVVATRFHSMILALLFDKPFFPFIYSNKTLNVIEDLEYDNYYLNISQTQNIDINKIVDQLTNGIFYNLSEIKDEANKQFLKLDEFYLNNI